MLELDENFSKNDRYLIDEYLKHGTDDFLLADFMGETFVVPYKYTVGSHTEKTSISRFMAALLDFETKEERKYHAAGEPVFTLTYKGRGFVVPFHSTEKIAPGALAEACLAKARGKYNMVINTHRMLSEAGVEDKPADFSDFMAEVYAQKAAALGKTAVLDNKTPDRLDVAAFLAKTGNENLKHFKTSVKKMALEVKTQIVKAEKKAAKIYIPKNYKPIALAVMLGGIGGMGLNTMMRNCSSDDKETKDKIETVIENKRAVKFVDFMGKEHTDSLGNIAKIHKLMPEISAMLIAVEGYAERAFLDGGGVPTIGSGTTFYLDDAGKEIKVRKGDKVTPAAAMAHKWRYIDKYMLSLMGDNFGREVSSGEAMASIGAGFCWGTGERGFGGSSFLKSLKENEDINSQMRKITGFRKQKGLLKRGFVLAQCLSGEWTAQDLLDLPIYEVKNKGYVHCAIYTLDLHEIMPCKKDSKGNYLKDKDGNDIPLVKEDNFCSGYYEGIGKTIKNKLIKDAELGNKPYKTVRDFMPKELLRELEAGQQGYDDGKLTAKAQDKKTYTDWVTLAQKTR